MSTTPIGNIILGREREATRTVEFEGWTLPESTEQDVGLALKAARAQPRIRIDAAVEALADIGQRADWISDADLRTVATRTGSTIRYLRTSIDRLNDWLAGLPESMRRHGTASPYGYQSAAGVWTGDVLTTLVLAGDATAVGPLALAHTVLAGARTVVKGSRFEPLAPILFLRALIDRDIPCPQLLFFNSAGESGRDLLTRMIEGTAQSVIYGEDRTIGSIYGRAATDAAHKKIGFWTGRSGVLVLPDADPRVAGRAIAVGTGEDRGNRCVSTMKAFVPADLLDSVLAAAIETAESFGRGDPLDPTVNIGRLPVAARQEALASVGTAKVLYDRDVLFVLCPDEHYLLREELPYPVCAIRPYHPHEDAIELVNASTRGTTAARGLELAVITAAPDRFAVEAGRCTACKIMYNRPTTELDHTTAHQGIYLFRELMRFTAFQ